MANTAFFARHGISANGQTTISGANGQILVGSNVSINTTAIGVGSNVTVGLSSLLIGNSTVNTFANSSMVVISGNNVLLAGKTDTISIGYTVTPANLGIISANLTINAASGNYQYGTANAAFTLTAPTSDCAVDVLLTNGTGAGTITLSGFTANATNSGDTYATTSTNKYILMIRRINSVATYIWKALQ